MINKSQDKFNNKEIININYILKKLTISFESNTTKIEEEYLIKKL
jgi:hypothetical protein